MPESRCGMPPLVWNATPHIAPPHTTPPSPTTLTHEKHALCVPLSAPATCNVTGTTAMGDSPKQQPIVVLVLTLATRNQCFSTIMVWASSYRVFTTVVLVSVAVTFGFHGFTCRMGQEHQGGAFEGVVWGAG